VFDPAWVANLTEWVERGGMLVIGARSASKDLNNHVISQTLPGVLSELAGVTVTEYGKQNAPEERPLWAYLPADQCQTRHWYEVLEPDANAGTEVLATWKGRHLDGQPAMTLRRVGQGLVIYAGVYLTDNLLEGLLPEIERHQEITKIWPFAPEGVEVVCRRSEEKEVWFFINYSDAPARLERVPQGGTNLITGQPAEGELTLQPNDVAVIQVARGATPGV
jgi:beta-galactosidase